MVLIIGGIIQNCRCHEFAKINRDCIPNHLFHIAFRSYKLECLRKCLNHCSLLCGKGANSIKTFYRIIMMNCISAWQWSVYPPYRGTWFVDTENASSDITSWMTIIVFNVKFITKIIFYRHFLLSKTFFIISSIMPSSVPIFPIIKNRFLFWAPHTKLRSIQFE